MNPLRLYLVRHGQTEANRELRYVGRRDDDLSAAGREQIRRLAEGFRGLAVAGVWTSPLLRTRLTAEALGVGLTSEPMVEPRLMEISYGDWEGLTREEIVGRSPEDAALHRRWIEDPEVAAPGGESRAAVERRVVEAIGEIAAGLAGGRPRSVVLVSHVGPIKALLARALEAPEVARRLFLDTATVTVVDWGERPVVRLVNAPPGTPLARAPWG